MPAKLVQLGTGQMLTNLIQPGRWCRVDAHYARGWTSPVSIHPASFTSSSCAHTGSHPLSAGAVSSQPWQAASRHHDFLLNNTSL